MINESIKEEDITLVNIYALNTGAPKYIKQILIEIKGKINSNTIVVGNFNLSLIHISEPTRLSLVSRMPSSA